MGSNLIVRTRKTSYRRALPEIAGLVVANVMLWQVSSIEAKTLCVVAGVVCLVLLMTGGE